MTDIRIQDPSDLAAIETRPYAEFMPYTGVYQALEDTARRHAGRKALTYVQTAEPADPARTWTYAEFLAELRRTANLFTRLAGDEPPRVAMLLPAIPEAYFTLFGAETAGVVCPINYLLGAEHVAELVRAAGANILVTLGPNPELDIWSRILQVRAACPGLKHVLAVGGGEGALDFGQELAATSGERLEFARDDDPKRLVALFHTGGTTGRPKLAQHAQGNQLHTGWGAACMFASRPDDVMINGFPVFHVAGSFVYGLSTLLAGAELLLPTLLGLRNKGFLDRYWTFVEKYRITQLAAVPTVISTLMSLPPPKPSTVAHVRGLLTGGSPLPDELAASFEAQFGIPVRNILGMTECAGVISIEPLAGPRVKGSCGIPLPFTEVRTIDDQGQPLPQGQTGVLCVKGPNVGPGYTETDRNAGTFHEGWLITGDIGHVDADGRLFITGRAKDVIVRSGHNIDPRVIEDALMRHEDVLLAAAVSEPDEYAGELPVAYVTLREGARVDMATLSQYAQQFIPERPAYPKRVDVLPELPLTAVGKIFKPALRMLSLRRAITDRLERAGLAPEVSADVVEEGARLVVVFQPSATADSAPLGEALRRLMAPFAVPYRLQQA